MLYLRRSLVSHTLKRATNRTRAWQMGAALCLSFGCSKLPELAEPKAGKAGEFDAEAGDLIRYRKLERADFKRKEPPPVVKQGQYELGAQTCAHLRSNPDVHIDLVSTTQPNGETKHDGRLRNLRFFAYMDRECSWWNPTNQDVAYTLEHEQIHFAISELEARRLNREAEKLMRELRVTASSKEEVVKQVQERLNALLEEHNEDALDRNRDFDKETSVGKNPTRQREWWKTVTRELAESEAWR